MTKLKNNVLYARYVDDINHGLSKTEEVMIYECLSERVTKKVARYWKRRR